MYNQQITSSVVSKKLLVPKRLIMFSYNGRAEVLGLVLRVDNASLKVFTSDMENLANALIDQEIITNNY